MSRLGSDSNPPLSTDLELPAEPPAWPKVVGIISIVWASLGLVCNGCSLIGGVFQGAIVNAVPPEQQEEMRARMASSNTPATIVSHALGILGAGLLLLAGIQTVRRLASGRPLHLAWALVSLPLAAFGGYVGWQSMQAGFQQAVQNDPNAAQAAGAMQAGGTAFFACIMVFVLIWPIFCIIWFGPMGKRPEAGAALPEPMM